MNLQATMGDPTIAHSLVLAEKECKDKLEKWLKGEESIMM